MKTAGALERRQTWALPDLHRADQAAGVGFSFPNCCPDSGMLSLVLGSTRMVGVVRGCVKEHFNMPETFPQRPFFAADVPEGPRLPPHLIILLYC